MTQPLLNPIWLARLGRLLEHWLAQTAELPPAAFASLDGSRAVIVHLVRLGLEAPDSAAPAAKLALQFSPLVEQRGYWAEWLPILQRGVEQVAASPLRVRLIDRLGFFLRLNRQLAEAAAVHRQASAEARALGLTAELPRIWFNLATTDCERHQFEPSRRCAEEALALYAQLPPDERDPLLQASLANLLGLLAVETGRPAEALPHLETAAALWTARDHPLYRARALNNRARALERLGRYAEALQTSETALALVQTDYPLDAVLFALNQGATHAARKAWSEAVETWLGIDLTYLRRVGHIQYEAMILTNLGDSYLRAGQVDVAEQYLRDAVRLWRAADDPVYLANAVGTLGEALAAHGRRDDAGRCWQEALDLLSRFPDSAWGRELTGIFRALLGEGRGGGSG